MEQDYSALSGMGICRRGSRKVLYNIASPSVSYILCFIRITLTAWEPGVPDSLHKQFGTVPFLEKTLVRCQLQGHFQLNIMSARQMCDLGDWYQEFRFIFINRIMALCPTSNWQEETSSGEDFSSILWTLDRRVMCMLWQTLTAKKAGILGCLSKRGVYVNMLWTKSTFKNEFFGRNFISACCK